MMEIGKEKKVARRKRFLSSPAFSLAPLKIIFRRAGYLPCLSLPKCLMVLSRPHKIVGQ